MWLEIGNGFENTINIAIDRYNRNVEPSNISKSRWRACVNQLFKNHGVQVNWEQHRQKLSQGEAVSFRPKGNSMNPKIKSGQLVTVSPTQISSLEKGDIVFCKVKGNFYVHLVTALKENQVQIGNNKGKINGWTSQIFGKVTRVED